MLRDCLQSLPFHHYPQRRCFPDYLRFQRFPGCPRYHHSPRYPLRHQRSLRKKWTTPPPKSPMTLRYLRSPRPRGYLPIQKWPQYQKNLMFRGFPLLQMFRGYLRRQEFFQNLPNQRYPQRQYRQLLRDFLILRDRRLHRSIQQCQQA